MKDVAKPAGAAAFGALAGALVMALASGEPDPGSNLAMAACLAASQVENVANPEAVCRARLDDYRPLAARFLAKARQIARVE